MDLKLLKSFANKARNELLKSVELKIEFILSNKSSIQREYPRAVNELINKIDYSSKEYVTEEVAYTWFNRFTALLYMDRNNFNSVKVILSSEGIKRPEILSEAFKGVFDKNLISENTCNKVSSLLEGKSTSRDPEK